VRIAVTGANGTIGRRLCADFATDHEVVRIDLLDSDRNAGVRDLAALQKAFEGCDALVHLAGVVSLEASWEDVYSTNIGGTYNAFEAARRAGIGRIIFASSNHAVGMQEIQNLPQIYEPKFGLVVGTESPFRPDSLYGVWKAFGEALGRYYSEAHAMQVACVRIGLDHRTQRSASSWRGAVVGLAKPHRRAEVQAVCRNVDVATRFRAARTGDLNERRALRRSLWSRRQRDTFLGPRAGPRALRLLARGRHQVSVEGRLESGFRASPLIRPATMYAKPTTNRNSPTEAL